MADPITATLMTMGKQMLSNMLKEGAKATVKKAVKSTAKKAVKSVVKKKKVKGKDIAKKMFGGSDGDKGGSLAIIPSADIVPSPTGDVVKSKETSGEIVKVSGTAAKDLGLNDFMESLTRVKDSVNGIKVAINDNNKDTVDRIEAQRILNNELKKKQREEGLESKKGGIGKKLLSPAKDAADNFLARMIKFAAMTILGSLIAALVGGAKDVVLAFRIGFELLKKGLPTLLKGVKALKSGIFKSFKLALKPFKSLGSVVFEAFKSIGKTIFGWVSKSISNITKGIKNFGKNIIQTGGKVVKNVVNFAAKKLPKVAQTVTQAKQFLGQTVTKGKDLVKNTVSKAKGIVKTGVSKVKGVVKTGVSKVGKAAKPVLGKVGKFIGKLFGKNAAKAAAGPGIKTLFKSMAKGAKAIKIPVVGPLLVALMSMFAGDPMEQTLFKTAGAAIGGGLGLALGPIGMFVGEIAGEFVGDVLYEGFMGEDGWAGAGKKLKEKFMQILSGGKKVGKWLLNSIKRIGWGGLGTLLNPLAGPKKKFNVLKEGFFPPAEMSESKTNTDAKDVSESASYEEGGEQPTVVVDGGGGESSAPSTVVEGDKFISAGVSRETVLNSQYEMVSNAALYKV